MKRTRSTVGKKAARKVTAAATKTAMPRKKKAASRVAAPKPATRRKKAALAKTAPAKTPASKAAAGVDERLERALSELRKLSSEKIRAGMARFAIPSDNAWGVSMGDMRQLGKRLGRDHELATALWSTGVYEARTLAAFVDDPALVTSAQMDRWCRDFDSWAICDTLCFHLFDKTPHAALKVVAWASLEAEFVKRAAFALIASLSVHDKRAPDADYERFLALIEKAADDERNFVKKGVNWALRCIGKRNAALHAAAVAVSKRLAAAPSKAAAWVGRDALRDLASPSVARRLERGRARAEKLR